MLCAGHQRVSRSQTQDDGDRRVSADGGLPALYL